MPHLIIQKSRSEPSRAEAEARRTHLRSAQDRLIAFGPTASEGQAAGHVWFTDHDEEAEAWTFAAGDPLYARSETIVHPWRSSRRGGRQAETTPRPNFIGYFMLGLGTRDAPERREALLAEHAAYFRRFDAEHFVARGPILESGTGAWRGSAVVIEVSDRNAFETYLAEEPFHRNGLYGHVEIYRWRRGEL